ncbi:MAG TPA: hypothetical protein VF828_04130 [Patescibacteria group bacterium]
MASKEDLLDKLNNLYPSRWGSAESGLNLDRWNIDPSIVTESDVIHAGMAHSCRVIDGVLARSRRPENPVPLIDSLRSYEAKNESFRFMRTIFMEAGRQDLLRDWNSGELRKNDEKTHPSIRSGMVYPSSINPRIIEPVVRMPAFYISNFLKEIELNSGERTNISKLLTDHQLTPAVCLTRQDLIQVSQKASGLDNLVALVAVRAAVNLRSLEVADDSIINLLTASFAKTSLVKEYGQYDHAERLVDGIVREMTASGKLEGLVGRFRHQARTKIYRYYFGQPNPEYSKR